MTRRGGNAHDILEGIGAGKGRIYASGISASADIRPNDWEVQPGFGGGPFDALLGLDISANLLPLIRGWPQAAFALSPPT